MLFIGMIIIDIHDTVIHHYSGCFVHIEVVKGAQYCSLFVNIVLVLVTFTKKKP